MTQSGNFWLHPHNCRSYGKDEKCNMKILADKHEENNPLGKSRRAREDNIKMDLRGVGY